MSTSDSNTDDDEPVPQGQKAGNHALSQGPGEKDDSNEKDDHDDVVAYDTEDFAWDWNDLKEIRKSLKSGDAEKMATSLARDICRLASKPRHFAKMRDFLRQLKQDLLQGEHCLVETTLFVETTNASKHKPRKRRKVCAFCMEPPDPKPKRVQTFRLCKQCQIPICTDPNCLQKHYDKLLADSPKANEPLSPPTQPSGLHDNPKKAKPALPQITFPPTTLAAATTNTTITTAAANSCSWPPPTTPKREAASWLAELKETALQPF